MNDSLTEALKEAFASAPTSKVIYNTLEIVQEGVQDPVYLVQARQAIVATDENGIQKVFEASGFQFSLPPASSEGFRNLNISIDNIDRQVSDFLSTARSTKVPVKAIFRPFLSDDLSAPQMNPPIVLFIKDVSVNPLQVDGSATFMDIVNKKFPSILYTRERFPGLG